ncbi:unnamed protein product [Cylicocyclus nassatus]|uniref:Uncharacterized protein n=1 Tax=Cylicocyclus nassatus TaxID=53992 RepID=A0AA36GYR2_CYLNA|nr:unnamed protein product [Cylicocyclus nassatus]
MMVAFNNAADAFDATVTAGTRFGQAAKVVMFTLLVDIGVTNARCRTFNRVMTAINIRLETMMNGKQVTEKGGRAESGHDMRHKEAVVERGGG